MRRPFYGWFDQKREEWRLSKDPPDAPARRSLPFETKAGLMNFVNRRHAEVLWFPPLTPAQERIGSMTES